MRLLDERVNGENKKEAEIKRPRVGTILAPGYFCKIGVASVAAIAPQLTQTNTY